MNHRIFLAACCLIAAVTAGCARSQPAADPPPTLAIQWYAASSATDAVQELRDRFVQQTGLAVELSLDSSSTLANQIMQGSGADLFLSANMAWGDQVAAALGDGVVQRCELLSNRLVIVVPASAEQDTVEPQDLLGETFREVALANPDSVPAGIYAKQALQKLELWDALHAKLIPAANVRDALQYVESGNIPIGIVYATDAAACPGVKVVHRFDPSLHETVIYPLLQLKGRAAAADTARLFDFLVSHEAAEVFLKHGFEPLHLDDTPEDSR